MVPGVGLSPDRMLQGRVFAYADAHRYRVGTNHQQLPVNAPRCPVNSYQRDGSMATGKPAATMVATARLTAFNLCMSTRSYRNQSSVAFLALPDRK